MNGGWAGSDRRSRLPADWPARVAAVRERASGRCEMVSDGARCSRPGKECDHVVPNDDHRLSNLRWLCWPHHRKKSSREGVVAKAERAQKRLRPAEEHPGLRRRP